MPWEGIIRGRVDNTQTAHLVICYRRLRKVFQYCGMLWKVVEGCGTLWKVIRASHLNAQEWINKFHICYLNKLMPWEGIVRGRVDNTQIAHLVICYRRLRKVFQYCGMLWKVVEGCGTLWKVVRDSRKF